MDRGFEKISFEQFKKDISDDKKLYDEYLLPVRKTKYSAGYDFLAINDMEMNNNDLPIFLFFLFLQNKRYIVVIIINIFVVILI